jgi:hypothetical protein
MQSEAVLNALSYDQSKTVGHWRKHNRCPRRGADHELVSISPSFAAAIPLQQCEVDAPYLIVAYLEHPRRNLVWHREG